MNLDTIIEKEDISNWIKTYCDSKEESDCDVLEAIAANVYKALIFGAGMQYEKDIDFLRIWEEEGLYEKDLEDVSAYLCLAVLLNYDKKNNQTGAEINSKQFAEAYIDFWGKVQVVQATNFEGLTKEYILLLQKMISPLNMNPPQKEESQDHYKRNKQFYLNSKANDFFKRYVSGDGISKEAELPFFIMFSLYVISEYLIENNQLAEIRYAMDGFKKNRPSRMIVFAFIRDVVKISIELETVIAYGITYQGLCDFLKCLDYEKRSLKNVWKGQIEDAKRNEKQEIDTMYMYILEFFANQLGFDLRRNGDKIGLLSDSVAGYLNAVREFFEDDGKKRKSDDKVVYSDEINFTLIDLKKDVSNDVFSNAISNRGYFRLWILVFLLLNKKDSTFLSVAGHSLVIDYLENKIKNDPCDFRISDVEGTESEEMIIDFIKELSGVLVIVDKLSANSEAYASIVKQGFKEYLAISDIEADEKYKQIMVDILSNLVIEESGSK